MSDLYWERAVTAVTAHVRTHQINIVATEWQQFNNDLHQLSDALTKLATITLDGGTEGQPGPDAWEGDAADAYRVYLDMFVTAVNDLRDRCEVVHSSISSCMGHAERAVGAIPVPVTDGNFGVQLPAGKQIRPMDVEDGNEIAKAVSADRRADTNKYYDDRGGFGDAVVFQTLTMLSSSGAVVVDGDLRKQTSDGVAQWWTSNNAHAEYAYGTLIGEYEGELPRCILDRATAELPAAQQNGGGAPGGGAGAGSTAGGGGVPGGGAVKPGAFDAPSGGGHGSLLGAGDGGLQGLQAAMADPAFSSAGGGTGRAPVSPPFGMVSPGGTSVGPRLSPKPPLTSYGKALAAGEVKGPSSRGGAGAMAGMGGAGSKGAGGEKDRDHTTYLAEDDESVWAADNSPDGPLGKDSGYGDLRE